LAFTLEPVVTHVKDIWMVQDPDSFQEGRRLEEGEAGPEE